MVATNIETRKMELIRFIITLQEEDDIAAFERVMMRIKKVEEQEWKQSSTDKTTDV